MEFNFTRFGKKLTKKSGILELMDDLGNAMNSTSDIYMLGGGNPAHIPEINNIWRKRMREILASEDNFEKMEQIMRLHKVKDHFLILWPNY